MLDHARPDLDPGSFPTDAVSPLLLDFLEWLARSPRPYAEAMEAWRTSCPRLTVWEDAVDARYVVRGPGETGGFVVGLTARGRRRLQDAGREPR